MTHLKEGYNLTPHKLLSTTIITSYKNELLTKSLL